MPSAARHHWTAADVRSLMDERRHWPRFELLDGELLVTPAPEPRHQLVTGELFMLIKQYVDREGVGVTFTSPADVQLAPESIMQPDVFVVPDESIPVAPPMRWAHVRRLLLAAEVLSPSSQRQDRVLKRDFYLANRVEHYWVIDPDAEVFECWRSDAERPTIVRDTFSWHPVRSGTPLAIDVRAFFLRCRLPRRLSG